MEAALTSAWRAEGGSAESVMGSVSLRAFAADFLMAHGPLLFLGLGLTSPVPTGARCFNFGSDARLMMQPDLTFAQ